MKPNPANIGRRPTKDQLLLLRAACWTGAPALAAWQAWSACHSLDGVSPESYRLLPLLYWNLRRHGVDSPDLSRLKGVLRKTWYTNQMALHGLSMVLRYLAEHRIRTMVLKGAALASLYYPDPGLRPMIDVDVAVPREQAEAALGFLAERGWKLERNWPDVKIRMQLYRHADHLKGPGGRELDLHWQVMLECCQAGSDQVFWDGAVPFTVGGSPTLALNPTDQLFHVLVNGTRAAKDAPLRWVADALAVLGHPRSQIDWDRLIATSSSLGLVLPVMNTLAYLRGLMEAPIPVEVLASLARQPVTAVDRLEYRVISRHFRFWGRFAELWYRNSRMLTRGGLSRRFLGYPMFVGRAMGLDHVWQVPFYSYYRRKAMRGSAQQGKS